MAPSVRIYHLANSGTTNWADFARLILKLAGLSGVQVEDVSSDKLKRPAPRPENSVFSFAKFKKELGMTLRPWNEALPEFLIEFEEVRKANELKAQTPSASEEAPS